MYKFSIILQNKPSNTWLTLILSGKNVLPLSKDVYESSIASLYSWQFYHGYVLLNSFIMDFFT